MVESYTTPNRGPYPYDQPKRYTVGICMWELDILSYTGVTYDQPKRNTVGVCMWALDILSYTGITYDQPKRYTVGVSIQWVFRVCMWNWISYVILE